MGAWEDINPKGFWEPVDISKMNHEFMQRYGSGYLDPMLRLQGIEFEEAAKQEYIGRVKKYLSESPQGPLLLIKDPQITEFLDLWFKASAETGFSVKVVIPIRHPREVFESIATMYKSSSMPVELVNAFWIRRNLLAEFHSRTIPRIFVEYSNLLKDWRTQIARVSKALSIKLHADEAAIDDFLSGDLHRQRWTGVVTETFAYAWTTRVYEILSAAARDEPIDIPTLDEIFHAYRTNERAFRVAFDEFRTINKHMDPKQIQDAFDNVPIFQSGRDF